ncbi:MAG: Protease synthase and sporulation protein 2 [Pseudomonadota bacterium]
MYLPKQFNHPEHARSIILENPFASLVSNDDEGFPFISHIPIKLMPHATDAQQDMLLGHVAKGNPHAGFLYKRPQVSYVAVHVKAEVRILEGEEAKDSLLKQLIADHEPAYAQQWRGLPETYTHPMMNAIVAFEMKLLDVQTKVKLNQHRPESHAAMHAAYDAGNESEKALALWMRRLGLVS